LKYDQNAGAIGDELHLRKGLTAKPKQKARTLLSGPGNIEQSNGFDFGDAVFRGISDIGTSSAYFWLAQK